MQSEPWFESDLCIYCIVIKCGAINLEATQRNYGHKYGIVIHSFSEIIYTDVPKRHFLLCRSPWVNMGEIVKSKCWNAPHRNIIQQNLCVSVKNH